jgi:hypothetical protein
MRVYGVQCRFGWLGFIDRISYSTRSRAIILPPKPKQTDITHPESWRKLTRRVGEITRKSSESHPHRDIRGIAADGLGFGPVFPWRVGGTISVIAP